MSRPNFYAGATYPSTTSLPSSTISTAPQHHKPLPPTRRRTPSELDEDTLPTKPFTTLTALVGDSDSDSDGGGDGGFDDGDGGGGHNINNGHNNGNSNTYTYNRNRGDMRSEHRALAYEQRHDLNTDVVVSLAPKAAIAVGINNNNSTNNNNHAKFHYRQRGRQQSPTTHNLAHDEVDDDIDGDEDEYRYGEEEEEEEGEEDVEEGDDEEDEYRTYDSSMQQRRTTIEHSDLGLDLDLDLDLDPDLDDHHQWQSQPPSHLSQSRTSNGVSKTVPTSKFAEPTTNTTSHSRGASYGPTPAYSRLRQSQHDHEPDQQHHHQHHHQLHHHQPSASVSVSNSIYSGDSHNHGHNLRRQQEQSQPQSQPQPQPQPQQNRLHHRLPLLPPLSAPPPPPPPPPHPPRAASSLATYNTTSLHSTTPRTGRTSRTSSAAAAPPRISSLLPLTRSSNATATAPILTTIVDRTEPAAATTSSNATVQGAPTQTQAQFVEIPFLDPLHPTIATSDDIEVGPGPGPHARPPSHSRANSLSTAGDSLRNLNRWSSSTASSRLSTWDYHHHQQQRQQEHTSFARRMSVDSIGFLSQHTSPTQRPLPPISSSPRKLSKQPPPVTRARTASASTTSDLASGNGATVNPLRNPSSSPSSPPNLPPIISLPPLDTDPESSFHFGSPRAMSRASPGLNTPNSVFASQHGNAEPQDYLWSDLSNPTRTASPAMRTNTGLLPPAPVTRDRDAVLEGRAHSRSRSAARGSADSAKPKDRSNSKPSQKAMLSKALNKANTAVQLDNAQNHGAAREAYLEACELLQHVLARTNGDDDRKKLEAIRRTYTSRIEELDELVPVNNPYGEKALPARPDSFDYHEVRMGTVGVDNQSDAGMITRPRRDESPEPQVSSRTVPGPAGFTTYHDFSNNADVNRSRQTSYSRSPMRHNFESSALTVPRHANDNYLPAPLSPRRPLSPTRAPSPEPIVRHDFSLPSERERLAVSLEFRSHRRNLSHESASWLDPIDESGGSTSSSVHSRSSSRVTRKHIRQPSGDTEAEFDAALDAAVEAAYDDGYEPLEPPAVTYDDEVDEDRIATSMRRAELAEELIRQTEREAAMKIAEEHERQRQVSLSHQSESYGGDFFDANDSDEEEERFLEEMTRGYVMEDFALNQQSRSQTSVPRESDSSGLTSRTWHSSMGSNPPTGTTTLSAVSEMASSGHLYKASSPLPPPTQSLPQPPLNRPPSSTGVRNRRLSGQTAKKLKIETSKLGPPPDMPPPPITASSAVQSQPSSYIAQQRQALSAISTRPGPFSARAPSPPVRGPSLADAANAASPPGGQDDEVRIDSPLSAPPGMRKNFSSSSLKSLRSRQISMPHIDDVDPLPMTPLSQQVSNSSVSRLPMMPPLPTPIATSFGDKTAGGFSGIHLFDSDFHSPVAQSPNLTHHDRQQNPDIPLPLEPCPSDPMFRPFWLMRALYQTLAHPRGGYISNRLFVPQDAWKVKGVKLRNIEDKMSQCDLLTAALLKLARVDSTDADAVLDEMQSFESILETVQATLARRLGTEVGTQGMVTFKDEKETEVPPVPRNNSISGKGGAFSWRRLRSKGSAVNLASTYGVKTNGHGGGASAVPGILEGDVSSPGGSIPSLPMVAHPSSRPAKRDVSLAKFDGPNSNYMASLARLFDAAQTVDQIARQVDDPGLRHADKTQVGLELCTRHAAEFFGFYICRFVLTDLGMLLDKFVKRGSEWVLS